MNTYKAEFLFRGYLVNVIGKYYGGRAQTYFEPEEISFFEPIHIFADDEDLSDLDNGEIETYFNIDSFELFWDIAEQELASQNDF